MHKMVKIIKVTSLDYRVWLGPTFSYGNQWRATHEIWQELAEGIFGAIEEDDEHDGNLECCDEADPKDPLDAHESSRCELRLLQNVLFSDFLERVKQEGA